LWGAKPLSVNCIFCQIAAKRAPAHYVYQDDLCTAFLDICSFNPGHTLVVPNEHFARLSEVPPQISAHLFKVAIRISQAIVESDLCSDGFNVFLSDGECAGQEVAHIHLHVLPRFEQDGLHVDLGRDPRRASPMELATTASKIAEHLFRDP
jgi:histidine triad (HIT) family protein